MTVAGSRSSRLRNVLSRDDSRFLSLLVVGAFIVAGLFAAATTVSDAAWLQWIAGVLVLNAFLLAGLHWLGVWSIPVAMAVVLVIWLGFAAFRLVN
jgi:hypothetical protein